MFRIVAQNDIHMRDARPENRIDNYSEAQFDKLDQLVRFANDHEAHLFLGGDFFDIPRPSAELVNRSMMALSRCKKSVHSCLGQHDIPYHQPQLVKSPMFSMEFASIVNFNDHSFREGNVRLTIGNWETPPTTPEDSDVYEILLAHISVFKEVPFYWKGEGHTPATLKEAYPGFDLYICGDIHSPLVEDNVVVTGSMMRQSIDQIDYKPRCYLIEIDGGITITPLYYDIKPGVFNVSELKDTEMDLDSLVKAMTDSANLKNSYKHDCLSLVKHDKPAQAIVEEIFDEIR